MFILELEDLRWRVIGENNILERISK